MPIVNALDFAFYSFFFTLDYFLGHNLLWTLACKIVVLHKPSFIVGLASSSGSSLFVKIYIYASPYFWTS